MPRRKGKLPPGAPNPVTGKPTVGLDIADREHPGPLRPD